jgi:serine/threonine protein kinase
LHVTQSEPSILEQAALASGLLTEEHLKRARKHLLRAEQAAKQTAEQTSTASRPNGTYSDDSNSTSEVNTVQLRNIYHSQDQSGDALMGEQLIELGYLNRWQVGQLLQGYTKFTLGSYQILDAIGKGGMGYVFKGEHILLGRTEAIKVLPKEQTTPSSIASFCHEIRALAHLDHPNLVRLTYADKDGETYFLVTEYVPGTNLRRLVRNHGPLSAQSAAMIIIQAAQGLQHAHQHGLVHRDVKPGNLMVTPEGFTKITDLGLAAFSSENVFSSFSPAQHCLKHKHIVGTPDYIAPEVITKPGEVHPASDIYSLGCTLYYAVTGKVPFPGGDTSTKLRCHLEEMPLAPQRLNTELDDTLIKVIADMMRKSPQERLSDAAQVILRLRPLTCSPDKHLLQEIGTLAQTSSNEVKSGSSIADTTPVATDQLETRLAATAQIERGQLAERDATAESSIASSTPEPPAPTLGLPLLLLLATALIVTLTAIVLVLITD